MSTKEEKNKITKSIMDLYDAGLISASDAVNMVYKANA